MMRALACLCLAVLAGCAGHPAPDVVVAPRAAVSIPQPAPLSLDPVSWHVLGTARLQVLLAQSRVQGSSPALMLDADGFEADQHNQGEMARYIAEQHAIIVMLARIVGADPMPPAPAPNKPDVPTP